MKGNIKKHKRFLIILVAIGVCGVSLMAFAYRKVSSFARDKVYTDISTCPASDIGILFGCGKFVAGGRTNLYYTYRIRAAAALYKAGKVKHLLVSGDNHSIKYNEPEAMKQDLGRLGVPTAAITCDYAGFSTFETIVRAKEIFGIQEATLITQHYHLPRALYISAAYGVKTVGYGAREPHGIRTKKAKLREIVARIATYGDINLWGRKPKFLGKKEYITVRQ
jgi:SanA protein